MQMAAPQVEESNNSRFVAGRCPTYGYGDGLIVPSEFSRRSLPDWTFSGPRPDRCHSETVPEGCRAVATTRECMKARLFAWAQGTSLRPCVQLCDWAGVPTERGRV